MRTPLLLICAAALLGACSSNDSAAPAEATAVAASPSQTGGVSAQLENTYWRLKTLDDQPAESPLGARAIHFVLHREGSRMSGFSGCNEIAGVYRLESNRITFDDISATLMACTSGMEIERQLQEMFSNVTGWKISGETLQLINSSGLPLATFESHPM
jgi:heat shock protein HslJ